MRLGIFLLFFQSLAIAGTAPVAGGDLELKGAIVPSGYNKAGDFIGYDNNDQVLITVLGMVPNTCTQPGDAKFEIAGDKITIRQTSLDYKDTGKVCTQTRMPFMKDVQLGVIENSNMNYKIVDGKTGDVIGKLPIGISPVSEPDSELYLSVTDARVWKDGKGSKAKWKATVVGKYNSKCTKLKEVKVDVLEKEHSIIVRPILERIGQLSDDQCEPTERLIAAGVVDHNLKGLWLLHVRSIQGAGKHELVDTDSLMGM